MSSRALPSKKFYFLEYFLIVLTSIEKYHTFIDAFNMFKSLKQEYRLGESKYKKLEEVANPTPRQQQRYKYTFKKVIDECKEYNLVMQQPNSSLYLTKLGFTLLDIYAKEGMKEFNIVVFRLMEDQHSAFRNLVEVLYEANPRESGVLIFPHYSPVELSFSRKDIKTHADISEYCNALISKLKNDVKAFLKQDIPLEKYNAVLIAKLIADGLIPSDTNGVFSAKNYNKITKRIRDYWINYFLKEVYSCPFSMTAFDIWVYRARQIGIVHATESYPFTNGKVVYPTSVLLKKINSNDFDSIYKYKDGVVMFTHNPSLSKSSNIDYQNKFVHSLVHSYFLLKRSVRYNFVSLISLREIVCYKLKISMMTFEDTLNAIYQLNLSNELNINISLEVDKPPEETNAMYLKKEPVMVDGKYRNIIAIDVARSGG